MPEPGRQQLDPYETLAPIDGMGEVYKAWDTRLNRHFKVTIHTPLDTASRGSYDPLNACDVLSRDERTFMSAGLRVF